MKIGKSSKELQGNKLQMDLLQERSKTEDKTQGGAPDSSTDTQVKGVESSYALKCLISQMKTPQIQIGTSRRLLKSNLDR